MYSIIIAFILHEGRPIEQLKCDKGQADRQTITQNAKATKK